MPYCRDQYEHMPTEEINRRVREMDLYAGTSLRSPPPAHDPIFTPIFTSIFTSIGLFTGSQAALLGTVAGAIATTALTAGLQMLRETT